MVGRQQQSSAGIAAFSEVERAAELAQFSEHDFLLQLGAAMRGARTNREMSRRELASRSGVSERYIALIEAGKGNVSVVLLMRILNVFRSELTDAA